MFPQEFFGAGLLHKEEVELRRALNASLREVRRSHTKKEEKPSEFIATTTRCVWSTTNTEVSQEDDHSDEPLEVTKTVCIGTNTMFRIKSDRSKKSDDTNKGKGGSCKKQKTERGQKINKASQQESELFKKPLKRKNAAKISFCSIKKKKNLGIKGIESEPSFQNGSKMPSKSTAGELTKSGVVGNKVGLNEEMEMSIDIVKKGFKSPTKTNKVCQLSGGQKPKMLVKDKAALYKPLHKRNMKGAHKSKIVQSLNAKFNAAVIDETLLSAEVKNDGGIQRDDTACSAKIKKKSFSVQNDGEKLEQMSGPSEVINSQDKNCELRLQVSNAGHGKMRRRLKHKLKDRKLVCPLGEIYIPANVAKTEDFLTFLCLRGKYVGSLL